MPLLRGIFPTVLTPWDDQDRLDLRALEAQVAYFLDAGVHGLVVLGSIGESPLVSDRERDQMVETAVRAVAGRVPVVVGITAHGTRVAAAQVERLGKQGATAALVAMPAYYDTTFADVRQHFATLGALGACPVLYYNYPPATRVTLEVEQLVEILGLPGVAGVKESVFDLTAIGAHAAGTADQDVSILTGSELDLVEVMKLGAHGAISAGAVTLPRTVVALYEACLANDADAAKRLQNQVFEALPTITNLSGSVAAARLGLQSALKNRRVPAGTVDTTVARLKAALAARGVPIQARVRAPLHPFDERDAAAVATAMEKIRAIEP